MSKRYTRIEGSVFGAGFVTMKHVINNLHALIYKIRMMDVELTRATFVYGDNMSVVYNTFRPEFTLKKTSDSIFYHTVR